MRCWRQFRKNYSGCSGNVPHCREAFGMCPGAPKNVNAIVLSRSQCPPMDFMGVCSLLILSHEQWQPCPTNSMSTAIKIALETPTHFCQDEPSPLLPFDFLRLRPPSCESVAAKWVSRGIVMPVKFLSFVSHRPVAGTTFCHSLTAALKPNPRSSDSLHFGPYSRALLCASFWVSLSEPTSDLRPDLLLSPCPYIIWSYCPYLHRSRIEGAGQQ